MMSRSSQELGNTLRRAGASGWVTDGCSRCCAPLATDYTHSNRRSEIIYNNLQKKKYFFYKFVPLTLQFYQPDQVLGVKGPLVRLVGRGDGEAGRVGDALPVHARR